MTDQNNHSRPTTHARPNYVIILILLVVFTMIEVAVSYLTGGIKLPLLVVLALAKGSLVVLYFMHAKFDAKTFSAWFLLGLALIIPLIIVLGLANPGQ